MPYSFVWLYLIKMCCSCSNICWSNPKRFLSVLVVFGKYFDLKIFKKIKKIAILHFRNSLVSGLLNREKDLEKFSIFYKNWFFSFSNPRHSRLTHDWLVSVSPSHEKDLEIFSKYGFKGFWRLTWRLILESIESRKMCVLQK